MIELVIAIVVVIITAWLVQTLLRKRENRHAAFMSGELGVPDQYQWDETLLDKVVDLYFDEVEEIEKEFCSKHTIGDNDTLPKDWISKLETQQKNRIKMKLMERSMAWVFLYRKMEAEMKRCFPLWKQNIISGRYWASLKGAEDKLESEFANIKKEVFLVDPNSAGTNTEIFKEACRIIDTYGYPPKPPKPSENDEKEPPPVSRQPEPIRQVTDNKTYELHQTADEAELVVFVSKDTASPDVKVALLPASITITRKGEAVFMEKLPEVANIKPSGSSWSLMKKNDFEPGDKVSLHDLTNESLNGQVGKVLKGTKETVEKARIRIELSDKKTVSIKPVNLTNADAHRKAAIVVSLEKAKAKSVWPMPPWEENANAFR